MKKHIIYVLIGVISVIAAAFVLTAFLEKPRPVLKIRINNDVKHFSALNAEKQIRNYFKVQDKDIRFRDLVFDMDVTHEGRIQMMYFYIDVTQGNSSNWYMVRYNPVNCSLELIRIEKNNIKESDTYSLYEVMEALDRMPWDKVLSYRTSCSYYNIGYYNGNPVKDGKLEISTDNDVKKYFVSGKGEIQSLQDNSYIYTDKCVVDFQIAPMNKNKDNDYSGTTEMEVYIENK